MNAKPTLARRLGITAPESPLLWKLRRLKDQFPSEGAETLEAWLVDVANSRGFCVVRRHELASRFGVPRQVLSDEELAVGIAMPGLADEPQMLRLAAQLVSRGGVDAQTLLFVARREGADRVLNDLATQALRVAPHHSLWRVVAGGLARSQPLLTHALHWTRLAEPVMPKRDAHRGEWRLVA